MSNESKPFIIKKVKKIKKGGHHGGSWKIAYADFVTAMMTFFLLMWLLSLLNKSQLEAIAAYFKTPLKAAFTESGAIHINSQINRLAKPVTEVKTKEIEDKSTGSKDKQTDHDKENKFDKNNSANQSQAAQAKALNNLKQEIEQKISADPEISQYKNMLNFVVTSDGLRIDMHDLDNKSMFSNGKADFQKYAGKMLSAVAQELNQFPNQVEIIGHTDSKPYAGSGKYDNWNLSADRANAARQALEKNGLQSNKIVRVIGVGSSVPLDKKDPTNPINRRIEIIVLSNDAMKKLQK